MAQEPKSKPSKMLSYSLIVEPPGNIADKLLAISGVEMKILHLEGLRERPHNSSSSFTRAKSADMDSAVPATVPSFKN